MMLFETLVGCIIILITNLSLLYTAHLLVRKYLSDPPPSVRLVATGVLYYSFILLIFQVLSPFHAISKTWVTVSCLLLSIVSHVIWGKQRNFQADIEPIRSWIRDGLSSRYSALIIICGFVVLLSLSRALLMPPLAWDCLTYHLTFAALWIKKGTIFLFKAPDQIAYCGLFPINGEILTAWLLLPFNNDLLVNTMNFPISMLGGISCYAIARELGLNRKEASWAPALLCFSPVLYVLITTEYVDIATFAFCSTSVLFTIRYLRRGYIYDYILGFTSAGILLGLKYSGIPTAGLIFIAATAKTTRLVSYSGFMKKLGLIIIGLFILCALGGRQYLINCIEARNPLYPFSLEVFHHEIFEGSYYLEHVKEWVSEYEEEHGWNKFSLWEKEYRKFFYINHAAGPKFLLFFILAFVSLFIRPQHIPRRIWFFITVMWIVPIFLFYANTSSDFVRRAYWTDGSFRFIFPFVALLTIQGLTAIKKISGRFKNIDYFFAALVAWDLLYINKKHLWEVEALYPIVVLSALLIPVLFKLVIKKSKQLAPGKATLLYSCDPDSQVTSGFTAKQCTTSIMFFILLFTGFYFLQTYRDNTRYRYYGVHIDHSLYLPRTYVKAWEFLDNPDEKKTIAMTMGWNPPSHEWFFYPVFGRRLQNDVYYVSAKDKWEVPTWLHKGKFRGNDYSIWLFNLNKYNIDYIFVAKPWPVELNWIQGNKDKFKLVLSDKKFYIFRYTGKAEACKPGTVG